MGQFDREAWYIIVLGSDQTGQYKRCRYLLATSVEDAKERAKIDTYGERCPYVPFQIIYVGQTQPSTVW